MPELPEVETVKRGLETLIVGKTIKTIAHDWDKSFPNDPVLVREFAIGSRITAVNRRAKVLFLELSSDYSFMVHLKMTGQLVYVERKQNITNSKSEITNKIQKTNPKSINEKDFGFSVSDLVLNEPEEVRFGAGHPNDSLVAVLPDKSTRVTITFSDASQLFFNDQRKFGWMKLLPTACIAEEPFMQKVGPEPFDIAFTDTVFIRRMRRRAQTSVKAALLDQSVLAGVGNIYADESLWGAKIHPACKVAVLSEDQLRLLHRDLLVVLQLAIDKGGSTDRNYVNAEGKKGSYIDFARVFRREKLPCPRCQTTITKIRVAGRGTHICPSCQVLYA